MLLVRVWFEGRCYGIEPGKNINDNYFLNMYGVLSTVVSTFYAVFSVLLRRTL